jgi:hypothetical protein
MARRVAARHYVGGHNWKKRNLPNLGPRRRICSGDLRAELDSATDLRATDKEGPQLLPGYEV